MTDEAPPPPKNPLVILSEHLTMLRNQVAPLQAKVVAQEQQLAKLLEAVNAQQAHTDALHALVNHTLGTQCMVIGLAASLRLLGGPARELLASAKSNALSQLPDRAKAGSQDAKTAEVVSDLFDRLEIEARAIEGTGGMN